MGCWICSCICGWLHPASSSWIPDWQQGLFLRHASRGRDGAGLTFTRKRKTARERLTSSLIKEHISGWIAPYLQLAMPSPKDQFWEMSVVSVGLDLGGGINCIGDELKLWSSKRLAGSELSELCSGPQESDTAQQGVGKLALTQRVSAQGGPGDGFGLENVTMIYLHHNVYYGVGACVFMKECWKEVHAIRQDLCQLHRGSSLLLSHLKTRLGISS